MFKVVEILDTNRIRIQPKWHWNNSSGDIIYVNGYELPDNLPDNLRNAMGKLVQRRLETLMPVNTQIVLSNPKKSDRETVYCDVLLNGVSISNYFPEYKSKA